MRLNFARVLLAIVSVRPHFLLAVSGIVVKVELGVGHVHLARLSERERVDLNLSRIRVHKRVIQLAHLVGRIDRLSTGKANVLGQLLRLGDCGSLRDENEWTS